MVKDQLIDSMNILDLSRDLCYALGMTHTWYHIVLTYLLWDLFRGDTLGMRVEKAARLAFHVPIGKGADIFLVCEEQIFFVPPKTIVCTCAYVKDLGTLYIHDLTIYEPTEINSGIA